MADDGDRPSVSPLERLSGAAGLLAFVYVIVWMVRISLLSIDLSTFNNFSEQTGSIGFRLFLGVCGLAILYHLLDGLRVVATEQWASLRRHDEVFRCIAVFCSTAVGLPLMVLVVQPWIESGA